MSEIDHGRRGFLRGRFRARHIPCRPPWALPEAEFLARCTRCNNCAIICPTRIVAMRDGYPEVDFAAGECTFCAECVRVCVPGALRREGDAPAWNLKARVMEGCVAARGVLCRICGEQCTAGAIRFPLRAEGPPLPAIDTDACTGCGACVAPCPVRAISVR